MAGSGGGAVAAATADYVGLTLDEERAARKHHADLARPPEFHPADGHAEHCARCGCESREHDPCCRGPCRGTDARDHLPCRCTGYISPDPGEYGW